VTENQPRELLQIIESKGSLRSGLAAAVELVQYPGKTKVLSAIGEPKSATSFSVTTSSQWCIPDKKRIGSRLLSLFRPSIRRTINWSVSREWFERSGMTSSPQAPSRRTGEKGD
jgi:hypothetical protein